MSRNNSLGRLSVKRKIEIHEENGNVEKKPRIVWNEEMHQKFLEAIDQLGHGKAFPKKIVELMNVQGLTRENVASHLQIKRDRSFRVCGDEKKNILLSIQENKVSSNTRFAGFRLASDGKSVEFGQNGHFCNGDWFGNVSESYILGVDESLPTTLTHRKPPTPPPTVMTQLPPAAGLQWTDWAEPPVFTAPQPPPGNEVNDNFEIFSEFALGTGIDENGVDATGISVFDDLLFDHQDLT
ncbi:hypothetical protein L2E82_12403 [Cichorium intybus]|uniref:Uncharacterized protein n=1 Tax=Cichorium intybus TaxID=13427 RepID=A0ACB9GH36_CICIN|nr:hypothetical protein L2E82_12403 [Cichorium intybus]